MSGLWAAFLETVERGGERPAILQGETCWSFAELGSRAHDYLAWLKEAGVEPGDRVLLWVKNGPEVAAAVAGVWGAGAIAVLADSTQKTPYLDHAIEQTEPGLLLHPEGTPPPAATAANAPRLVSSAEVPSAGSPASVVRGDTDDASILFTSGSTARPKGVVQTQGSLQRACRSVAGYLNVGPETRLLCPITWAFDYGFGQLHMTLLMGATQILPAAPNPFAITAAIEAHRPDTLAGIPSLFALLLQGLSPFRAADLSSLRTLTSTGAPLAQAVLSDLREVLPEARLFLNYGLTESYRTACLLPEFVDEHSGSVGRAIPGVEVVILREDGSLAAPGEEGEIVHRGDFLFRGYWNDSEATARALRADPCAPADEQDPPRALFTGDLGHFDAEGFLYVHGRRDRQLKSMGVRVSPTEVEELLLDSGLLVEAAVFGVKHDLLGHEVTAAVAPREGVVEVARQLKAHAREVMSPYMQPRRYVILEALPKTAHGKLDYRRLERDLRTSPGPDRSGGPPE